MNEEVNELGGHLTEHEALSRLCELMDAYPDARVVDMIGSAWSAAMIRTRNEIWFTAPMEAHSFWQCRNKMHDRVLARRAERKTMRDFQGSTQA